MIFAAFIWIPQHLHTGELGLTPRIQITVISSTSRPKIWAPSVPSVHLQAWLLWKWFRFAHWTLIELTSSSFATNIHFDYVFWVRNLVFSMLYAFSNHQLTSKHHHQLNRLRIARCLLECDCFDLGRTTLQEFLSRHQPPRSTRRPVANGGDGFEGVIENRVCLKERKT